MESINVVVDDVGSGTLVIDDRDKTLSINLFIKR